MNKRVSLATALQGVSRKTEARVMRPAAVAAEGGKELEGRVTRPASRVGKKTVAAHFDPAVSKQLKLIGLEADRSTQDLLREAINDLFVKYGKGPIA
jgi:hypothetical protein